MRTAGLRSLKLLILPRLMFRVPPMVRVPTMGRQMIPEASAVGNAKRSLVRVYLGLARVYRAVRPAIGTVPVGLRDDIASRHPLGEFRQYNRIGICIAPLRNNYWLVMCSAPIRQMPKEGIGRTRNGSLPAV